MAQVKLGSLTKTFGETIAVNEVSMTIRDGEIFVLLGPSGCGKTTTLRMIAGLETPDSGDVYIGGKRVNEFSTRERDIALMFQLPTVYPHMTVEDNIAFPLRTQKFDGQLINRKVQETAEMLQLRPQLDTKASKLSGGKKQAVALARAMVRDPQVFLMDEPTTALDAKLRERMQKNLKIMHEDLKATIIYVTHDQLEAMNLADRIAVMDLGVIQQIDSPEAIYEDPSNLFVANFLGSPGMNFLDCQWEGKDGLSFRGFKLNLPQSVTEEINQSKLESKDLVFGLRPENIKLVKSSPNSEPNHLVEGEVDLVEPLGSETIVHLKAGEELIKIQEGRGFSAQKGEQFWCDLNSSKIKLFDKDSEQAII